MIEEREDYTCRAWDKTNNKMIVFNSFYELQKWNKSEEELKNFILMDYTRMEDVNDKLIYEGDIVELSEGSHVYFKGIIIYDATGYQVKSLYERDYYVNMFEQLNLHSLEVIGNIYENPKLLKSK